MTDDLAPVDFDLHGFVGIRLLNAGRAETRMIERQVGPLQAALDREPDIVIEFVDRIEVRGPLRLIGAHDAAHDDGRFFVLRGRHKKPVRVILPLDELGGGCRVVAERGAPAIPMLIPLINMIALAHDVVPVHGSAFVYRGVGVLATGWAKGGKTETLLSFMAQGASYVGDEWVYLTADGLMRGIPEPIRFWNWHLAELPGYRRRLARSDRVRLDALDRLAGTGAWLGSRVPGAAGRLAARAAPVLRNQAYVQIPPRDLFEAEHCQSTATLDRLLLVTGHEASGITVEPIEAGRVAERMVASNEHERLDFLATYLKHRYAFPDRHSELVESAPHTERKALAAAFAGRSAWVVGHPYPVAIPDLFPAVWPVIGGDDVGPQTTA